MLALFIKISAIVILGLLVLFVKKRTNDWLNPFTICAAFFFFPMILATFKLFLHQVEVWHSSTIILLVGSTIVWGIYPFLFLTMTKRSKREQKKAFNIHMNTFNVNVSILLAVAFCFLYLYENYQLTGHVLPFLLGGGIILETHTLSLPVIRFITKSSPAIIGLLLISGRNQKKWITSILALFVFLIPLTRLSRIDTFLSLLTVILIVYNLGIFKRYKLKKLVIAGTLVGIIGFLSAAGNIRGSHFGKYNFSYANAIQFTLNPGPAEIFAVIYGYFALPFESLDRLIRKNPDERLYGAFSLSPLANSIIELDKLVDFPTMDTIKEYDNPVMIITGVSTSLAYFYMDFGPIGALLPMFVYMSLYLYLYRKKRVSPLLLLLFALYSSFFSLVAFQAFISNPQAFRMLMIATVPFFLELFSLRHVKERREKLMWRRLKTL